MKSQITTALDAVLPKTIKDSLFGLAFRLAPERFREFAYRFAYAPNPTFSFAHLAMRGLRPKVIVDIGAFHGDWSRLARSIWPDAELTMIEANPEKAVYLEKVAKETGATLHMCLLGPREGETKTFYLMESGSSILEENSPLDRKAIRLPQVSLDSLMDGRSVDFLKLDVQGYELEVLKGAERLLKSVQAVQLEVSLIEINKGAPLLAEVVGFMAERGFEVCEVLELHRRPLDEATNQVDLLFVPKDSVLLADKRHFA